MTRQLHWQRGPVSYWRSFDPLPDLRPIARLWHGASRRVWIGIRLGRHRLLQVATPLLVTPPYLRKVAS